MSLAEQLAWQRAENERKAAEKKPEAPSKPAVKQPPMKNGKPDLSALSLAEQLAWNKQQMEEKAKAKEEEKLAQSVRSEQMAVEENLEKSNRDPLPSIHESQRLGTIAEEVEPDPKESFHGYKSQIIKPKPEEKILPKKPPAPRPTVAPGDRRQSHMDALKNQITMRFAELNKVKKADSDDENEESSESFSD